MAGQRLHKRIGRVRRRLLWVGATAAVGWGLAASTLLLLASVWLDLLWELAPQWRIAAVGVSGSAGLALVAALTAWTAALARDSLLAARLDRAGATGGEILTGLELDRPRAALAGALAGMAARRAAERAAQVPTPRAVPARPVGRSLGSLIALGAGVGLLAACLPGVARTQWDRFTNPFGDVPPFSRTELIVEPGDVEVVYGRALDLHVSVEGEPVDRVEIVLVKEDGQEAVPMFPEPDGRWRAVLSRVTERAAYYARARRTRSLTHRIGLITVPEIEQVRFRITPPDYTRLGPYEGPLPKEGIAGLAGTQVHVWARSNRPLEGGRIVLTPARGRGEGVQEVAMQPTGSSNCEAVGEFEVACDGRFELRVTDEAGQPSQGSFSGAITRLADHRPFIRILQPKERSLATPGASLPVVVSAEDDYGIGRVELFRSLNDSRALPFGLPLEKGSQRRVYETVYLPLAEYGLSPGDEIKLFGRVEDNDPAGAKGAESRIVEVTIIPQEEFERMLRIREGARALLSKYREARRRMEGLAEETEGLRKKIKDRPKDFPPRARVREETRRRLRRLVKRLRDEAEQMRRSADHMLPVDLDRGLTPRIGEMGDVSQRLARELEELLEEAELDHERLARHLESMTNRLADERRRYEEQVMEPLEHFEKVFPLIADQARFVVIVLRQKDLAQRMASLRGRDGEDSPDLKARMRDLEEEQRTIRQDLGALLDEIESHAAALPDEPELEKLRETAQRFARDVRSSGAAERMAEAESALAEFAGTRAHEKAKQAAEILARFVKSCQSMGGAAGECLVFQPSLGACLGDSVSQMLGEMGLGGASGFGMGAGVGGGFSAQRAAGRNLGLYGSLPGMGDPWAEGSGRDGRETTGPGGELGPRANPDEPSMVDMPASGRAGGMAEGAIPVQYRRRVGQYFQRLAEELGR